MMRVGNICGLQSLFCLFCMGAKKLRVTHGDGVRADIGQDNNVARKENLRCWP